MSILYGYTEEQPYLPNLFHCICTTVCDCQRPEPVNGIAYKSNECPIHNDDPQSHPECRAENHHPDL